MGSAIDQYGKHEALELLRAVRAEFPTSSCFELELRPEGYCLSFRAEHPVTGSRRRFYRRLPGGELGSILVAEALREVMAIARERRRARMTPAARERDIRAEAAHQLKEYRAIVARSGAMYAGLTEKEKRPVLPETLDDVTFPQILTAH